MVLVVWCPFGISILLFNGCGGVWHVGSEGRAGELGYDDREDDDREGGGGEGTSTSTNNITSTINTTSTRRL